MTRWAELERWLRQVPEERPITLGDAAAYVFGAMSIGVILGAILIQTGTPLTIVIIGATPFTLAAFWWVAREATHHPDTTR